MSNPANNYPKSRSTPTPGAPQGGRKPSRAARLAALFLTAFVLLTAYAAWSVYHWSHDVAFGASGTHASALTLQTPAPAAAGDDAAAGAAIKPGAATDSAAQTNPQATPQPQGAEAAASSRITLLLLGVDQRPDEPVALLTDTMIVLTVDPHTNRVGMISLPRDLFVPIAEYGRSGKINTAFMAGQTNHYPGGGGALSKRTVSEFLGYPIDYYVTINFGGFVQAIDAIGGIDVVVPKTIHDEKYPTMNYGLETFHLEAGPQHLDGETALKYVRTRHQVGDSDLQRAQRQQQVLLAVKDKLIADKMLNPVRMLDLLRVLSKSIKHDIPTTKLPGLLSLASGVQFDSIERLVLDTHYAQVDANSPFGWILIPNRTKIRPAVDKIFASQAGPTAAEIEALTQQQARQQAAQARQQIYNDYQVQAEQLRARLQSEGARISVLNGTGDPLLAERAADWLRRQGYTVVETKDAARSDYQRTSLVTYRNKPVATAGLTDMFAIARENIQNSGDQPGGVDLRLTIGRDFYLLISN